MATRTRRSRRASRISYQSKGYDRDGPDFEGGGGFHIPEGDYPMKCTSVEQKESKSSGNEMLEWVFTGTTGKAKGKTFYLYTVLDQVQKVCKTLEACGVEVDEDADGPDFDPDEVEGAEVIGEVYTDDYNGEKRSKLRRVMSPDDASDEEEDEDRPAGRRTRRAANGKRSRPTKLSEDEVTGLDEEELEALIEKHELEVDLTKAKTLSKKRNAVLEALTEADLIA
jgi:hypothetical protein